MNALETKKILKIYANELFNCAYSDAMYYLNALLSFLKNNAYIWKYISKATNVKYDFDQIISHLNDGDVFSLPINDQELISFVYQLLAYGMENFSEYRFFDCRNGYKKEHTFLSSKVNFDKIVVKALIDRIDAHLMSLIYIDKKREEKKKMGEKGDITVLGDGNIVGGKRAKGKTIINKGGALGDLEKAFSDFYVALQKDDMLSEKERAEVLELVKELQEQGATGAKKQSIFALLFGKLKSFATSIAFASDTMQKLNCLIVILEKMFSPKA